MEQKDKDALADAYVILKIILITCGFFWFGWQAGALMIVVAFSIKKKSF